MILVALLASTLAAAPMDAGQDKASAPATAASEKLKCRRLDVTGSATRKLKVCRTPAEWKEMAEAGNRAAREAVDGALCADVRCNGGQ